jgi:hypothetical protein
MYHTDSNVVPNNHRQHHSLDDTVKADLNLYIGVLTVFCIFIPRQNVEPKKICVTALADSSESLL